MRNSIKLIVVLGLAGLVSACGQQEEVVELIDTITVEPEHTGKYK